MLWSLKENTGGTKHSLKWLYRALFRVPATHHFDLLSRSTDKIKLVVDDNGNPVLCKGCGYANVRLVYPGDWEVEACSSTIAYELVNDKEFDDWIATMPSLKRKTEVR